MYSESTIERFWSKVEVGGEDECWLWKGAKTRHGYGSFSFRGKCNLAHRIAFLLHNGYLEGSKDICHSCDMGLCCNPRHLWEGTALDNIQDMFRKGRNPDRPRGSRNPFAKLIESDVVEIRRLVKNGMSRAEAGRMFGINKSTASNIVKRKSWKHV